MTVSQDAFEKQIRFLKKNYKILSGADLQEWLNRDGNPVESKGAKGVLITFDDGYGDNYTNALPILRRYLCPAIFFVSTGLINNDRQFEHDKKFYPQLSFRKMTWQELQLAMESGIDVGIHTETHANLGQISFVNAREEIEKSLEIYEAQFGRNGVIMSYPFGGEQDITQEVVAYVTGHSRITALFSAYGGKNVTPFDRYNLKRSNVGSNVKGLMYAFRALGDFEFLFGKRITDIFSGRQSFWR
jgi:peptidoglycan/xylan/chitin deacetylase (PgdA/CDA1 family)